MATLPLPPEGSPALHSGGQNQKWPTSGPAAYITRAAMGVLGCFRAGNKISNRPQLGRVATYPPRGGSQTPHRGGQNQQWLRSGPVGYINLACLRAAQRVRAGDNTSSRPQVGQVTTPLLPPRWSPTLHGGGQNHEWPMSGPVGYIRRATWAVPNASDRGGGGSLEAYKWAGWLHNPCRIAHSQHCKGGAKITTGPQKGRLAT